MKKLICALVICLFGALAFGAEATFLKAPELPENVLLVVEWPSLATLQGSVQNFANAIKPGTPVPPIAAALVQLTKSADPSVLDSTLPQRLLVVKDAEGVASHVSVLHVTDAQAFMDSLLPTLHDNGSSMGLKLFVEKKKLFNRKAYMKASAQERQNIQMFLESVENPVVIGTKDKYAFVGKAESAVKTAMDVVATGALSATPALGEGDLAVFANVEEIMAASLAGQGGVVDVLREKMNSAVPFAQMGEQGVRAEAVLGVEIDAFEALMAQVATCHGCLSVDAGQMSLKFGMDAVPGTKLAAYLASIPEGPPDTLKYLPKDAFFAMAIKMGDMMPLAESFTDFQAELMAIQGTGDGEMANMASMTRDALEAYGDDFSFAMRAGEGIQMVEVIRLKNKAAAATLIAKMADISKQVTSMYKSMGMGFVMDFEPAAHTYNGHEISEWKISFDGIASEKVDPEVAAMQAQQAAAMKMMFGDAMMIDAAVLDNDWVLAVGKEAFESLKAIMDGTSARLGDQPTFHKAVNKIDADSEGVLYLHLTDMVKWAMSFASQMGEPMPVNVDNLQFERGPAIVAAFNVSGAQTVWDIHIPTAEIKNLLDGFMGMRGKRASGAVRAAPSGPGRVRTPPPTSERGLRR